MFWKMALRNALVHWRQSFAALLSISGAFFCFVLFQGYMLNVEDLYFDAYRNRAMYGDVIFENKNATTTAGRRDPEKYSLTAGDQNLLTQIFKSHLGEIAVSVRHLYFQGLITTGRSSKVFLGQASDVSEGAIMRDRWRWNVLYGKPLQESSSLHPIVLGQSLALQLGCEPEKRLRSLLPEGGYVASDRAFHCLHEDVQLSVSTQAGNLNAMDFSVSGIIDGGYKEIDSRFVNIALPLAQKLLNSDRITMWTVKLKPGINPQRWIEEVTPELSALDSEIRAVSWVDHPTGDLYRRTMSLLAIFGNFVSVVVAFISLLSVMNTMVKIVKERTREIGTFLSLGFQRTQVLSMFLYESFFLGFFGCALGATGALLASVAVNGLGITYRAGLFSDAVPFRILLSGPVYFLALLLLLGVAVFTCYLACRLTVRKKIVECLGYA